MAFVCTLDLTGDLGFNVFSSGVEHAAQCTVGYDDDMELSFAVVEADLDGHAYEYRNGLDTRNRIRDTDDRAKVLVAACTAVKALIDRFEPMRVFRCVPATLPEKALRKHLTIHEVFTEAGYTILELEQVAGTRAWLMERVY
jgi:hypothetical protein